VKFFHESNTFSFVKNVIILKINMGINIARASVVRANQQLNIMLLSQLLAGVPKAKNPAIQAIMEPIILSNNIFFFVIK